MRRRALFALLSISLACTTNAPSAEDGATSDGESSGMGSASETGDGAGDTGLDDWGDGDGDGDTGPAPECGVLPEPCGEIIDRCRDDLDGDGVHRSCDNAPEDANPDQSDMDADQFGDAWDLCPTVASMANTADVDRDGVGNECDRCRLRADDFNENAEAAGVPVEFRVRVNPDQADQDRDGIGDACDNCVRVANCGTFGDENGQTPHEIGMDVDPEAIDCQVDANADMIGDACEGVTAPGAAGPVGFGPADDFDQDGLTNADDGCDRIVLERHVACSDDADCPNGASCTSTGICGHVDLDGDGVGDRCDTCPGTANPEQLTAPEVDDPDGDFVGNACETSVDCEPRRTPWRVGFYDVAAGGMCCTTQYQGQPLTDADGNPVSIDDEAHAPGVAELPPGCAEALVDAGVTEATPVTACDVADIAFLYRYACRLPPADADFDGDPDECDLCEWVWSPEQEPYVDANMMLWPDSGAQCNGPYLPSQLCGVDVP